MMRCIQGISRHKLQLISLEDKITIDNPAQFINIFVKVIDFDEDDEMFKFEKQM